MAIYHWEFVFSAYFLDEHLFSCYDVAEKRNGGKRMPYIFLSIALLAGATKGYCGKRTSGKIEGWHNAILANFIRMLLCILIGFGVVAMGGGWKQLIPDGKSLAIYILSGVSTSVFVVTWLIAVRTSAYVLMNVFLMLGVIVPMALGSLCYGETIAWNHWSGLAVLLVAICVRSMLLS